MPRVVFDFIIPFIEMLYSLPSEKKLNENGFPVLEMAF